MRQHKEIIIFAVLVISSVFAYFVQSFPSQSVKAPIGTKSQTSNVATKSLGKPITDWSDPELLSEFATSYYLIGKDDFKSSRNKAVSEIAKRFFDHNLKYSPMTASVYKMDATTTTPFNATVDVGARNKDGRFILRIKLRIDEIGERDTFASLLRLRIYKDE